MYVYASMTLVQGSMALHTSAGHLDLDTFDFTALTDVTVLAIVAQPVTTRRRDTEDLRSGRKCDTGFFLLEIDVPGDHTTVHVQPQLPSWTPANASEANLASPILQYPRRRCT